MDKLKFFTILYVAVLLVAVGVKVFDVPAVDFFIDNYAKYSPLFFTSINAPLYNYTSNNSVFVNITMTEEELDTLIFNWDGTNYTFYNDSLVLMLNLDNNSRIGENDTLAVDSSSYSNNASIFEAVYSAGKYGYGLTFDGISSYLNISTKDFSISSGTIETWFKPSLVALNHTIISIPQEGSEEDNSLVLYMRFNNNTLEGEAKEYNYDKSMVGW